MSANTYLISRSVYVAIFFIGFLVAFIWSHNVKKIAFGTTWDRIAYSLGASVGSILGLYLIKLFVN